MAAPGASQSCAGCQDYGDVAPCGMSDWTYHGVRQALGLQDELAWFQAQWAGAAESFEPGGDWLPTPPSAAETCAWIGMDEAIARLVVQGVREVAAHPALNLLAWQYYWALFAPAAIRPAPPVPWVSLPPALDFAGRLFQAVVILSGVPRYRREHAQRGIPEAITRDNLAGIELWIRNYYKRFGMWGFDRGPWLNNHLCCRLVRMERLEFGMSRLNFGFAILRQRVGEPRLLALAETGIRLRRDGRWHNAQGTDGDDPGWSPWLRRETGVLAGYPVVSPNVVAREPVALDHEAWEVVLQSGDPVLDVHIPARGRLEPAAVDDSFARALDFFPRYFPEHAFKGFTCGSWLVDPQLEEQMPGSNMGSFAMRFHHLPAALANDTQTYELGLGGRRPLSELPRDTGLRRALVAHLERGGQWWYTNGIVLREEVSGDSGRFRRWPGY